MRFVGEIRISQCCFWNLAHYIKEFIDVSQWSVKHGQQPTQQSLRRIVLMLNQTVNYQTPIWVQLVKSTRTITKHYILLERFAVTTWSSDGLAEAVESKTNEQQPLLAVPVASLN